MLKCPKCGCLTIVVKWTNNGVPLGYMCFDCAGDYIKSFAGQVLKKKANSFATNPFEDEAWQLQKRRSKQAMVAANKRIADEVIRERNRREWERLWNS